MSNMHEGSFLQEDTFEKFIFFKIKVFISFSFNIIITPNPYPRSVALFFLIFINFCFMSISMIKSIIYLLLF